MPRAVIADQFGGADAYHLRDLPARPLQAGKVRVAIKAAGISYVDVLTAEGRYQVKPPLPFTPGSEAAGTVTELGEGVTGLAPGTRVSISGWGGLFAEEAVVSARMVRPIPDDLPFAEAAVFPVSFATALHALVGSVAKIVKLEHAWRRLNGWSDDGFQVAPFPG